MVTPFPSANLGAVLYDPADSSIYIASYNAHNVTVISGTATSGWIQVGLDPSSLAYDPVNQTVFVANYGSGNISVIDASTNAVTGSFTAYAPSLLAYDSHTNALYTASRENGEVNAYNATTYASLGSPLAIQSSIEAGGVAYDANDHDIYVSNFLDSSISVISSVTQYPVTFTESGLPTGTSWSVILNGTSNESATPDIGFVEPNGTDPFTVGAVPGYVANVTTSSVTVNGAPVPVEIGFSSTTPPASYPVTFTETGLATGTSWSVTLNSATEIGTGTVIEFNETSGAYSYSVRAVTGYTITTPTSGTVTVTTGAQNIDVTFQASSPGSYTVTFTEAGLPSGTNWSLTLNSEVMHSVTTTIVFSEIAGSYAFTIGDVQGYSVAASASSPLTVSSANLAVTVTFTSTSATPAGTSGLSAFEWALLVVVILVVVFAIFLLLNRRQKKASQPLLNTDSRAPPPTPPPPAPPK